MGASRALIAVALQALLMSGVRNYRGNAAVAAQSARILTTAASLDYVLMLATDSAGTPIPAGDVGRAIHDGFSRAVDDALLLLQAIVSAKDIDACAFAREGLRTVRSAIDAEALADDERTFALIALGSELSS